MAVLSLPYLPLHVAVPSLSIAGHPLRTLFLCLLTSYALRTVTTWIYNTRNLPPGPPKHLLLDNRGDMEYPLSQTYRSFKKWHEKYGDVISFWLGRKGWVSLGSIQAATDLLEKRGAIYSSRPKAHVTGDILTRNMRGLGMPYGQRWRNWKQLMHASMNIEAAKGYRAVQDAESKLVLRDILQSHPEDWKVHLETLRRYAVSVVTVVCYGRRIKDLNDNLVVSQEKMDQYFILNATPGKFLVDIFPILSYLPKPLQWWRPEPERQFQEDSKLLLELMHEVRERMSKGLAYTSTATRALEKQGAFGLNDLETAYALNAPFGAGAGTTLAQIDFFILAMLHYPDTMRLAQAELDRVVGRDRLPEFDDQPNLPYVNALIKEVMRWRTIAPMGVPHSLMEDDVYEGKVIPKGTTVIASIYTMTQDAETFPEPDAFKPERYLDNPSLPYNFLFGFGRRLCPGMHVAQNSLFSLISKVFWAFDVLPPMDSNGEPILPSPHAFVGGIVIKPVPFGFVLRAREGKNVETVVLAEAAKAVVQLAARRSGRCGPMRCHSSGADGLKLESGTNETRPHKRRSSHPSQPCSCAAATAKWQLDFILMTSKLPLFLAIPATHFFAAARAHTKHEPVLIGGAAVGMHGLLQGRYTNDLDINLVDTQWLSAAFGNTGKAAQSPHQWLLRAPEVTGRRHYKLTWLDPEHATKLDIVQVDKEEHELQLKHSSVSADGIRYASVPLLMAKKVTCFTDRARGSRDPKAVSDFTDLEMLISHIAEYGIAIPGDIKARLLGREVIYGLYRTLENTRFSSNGELDFMILQWMHETGAMPEDVATDLMERRVISGEVN